MSTPESPIVPIAQKDLKSVPLALMVESRESVADAIIRWAAKRIKRRIMNRSLDEKELERLLQAARAAGDAEGYARAKAEMALEKARETLVTAPVTYEVTPSDSASTKAEKLELFKEEAKKAVENEVYKTRVTVTMTKAIALDYIKSVAPRIVGPSEIKKNSEKNLDVFISFGTLQRAMAKLVTEGEVELIEPSRWRYKGAATAPLRSVK
jgi:hypothetical protein